MLPKSMKDIASSITSGLTGRPKGVSGHLDRQRGPLSFLTWAFFLATFLKMEQVLGGPAQAHGADASGGDHLHSGTDGGVQTGAGKVYLSSLGLDGHSAENIFAQSQHAAQHLAATHAEAAVGAQLHQVILPTAISAGALSVVASFDGAATRAPDAPGDTTGVPTDAPPGDHAPISLPLTPVGDPLPVIDHVVEAVSNLPTLIADPLAPVLAAVDDLVSDLPQKVVDFASTAVDGVGHVVDGLPSLVAVVADPLAPVLAAVDDLVSDLPQKVVDFASTAIDGVGHVVDGLPSLVAVIGDPAAPVLAAVDDLVSDLPQKVVDVASTAVDGVGHVVDGLPSLVAVVADPVLSITGDGGGHLLQPIDAIATTVMDGLGSVTASLTHIDALDGIGIGGGISDAASDILHLAQPAPIFDGSAYSPPDLAALPAIADLGEVLTPVASATGSALPHIVDTALSDIGISAGGSLSFTTSHIASTDDFGAAASSYSQYGIAISGHAFADADLSQTIVGTDDGGLSSIVATALGHGPALSSSEVIAQHADDFALHLPGSASDPTGQHHLSLFG